jgi:hypothetical protein
MESPRPRGCEGDHANRLLELNACRSRTQYASRCVWIEPSMIWPTCRLGMTSWSGPTWGGRDALICPPPSGSAISGSWRVDAAAWQVGHRGCLVFEQMRRARRLDPEVSVREPERRFGPSSPNGARAVVVGDADAAQDAGAAVTGDGPVGSDRGWLAGGGSGRAAQKASHQRLRLTRCLRRCSSL